MGVKNPIVNDDTTPSAYMKAVSIFELVFIITLLLPVACFLIYASSGLFINFYTLYFIFFILLLVTVFPSTLKFKSSAQKSFLLFFLVANLLTLTGHMVSGEGLIEFLRTFSTYYFFIILGWLLYYLYYKQGKMERLTKLFIRAGVFIATANLFQYVLLNTDDLIIGNYSIEYNRYAPIVNYTIELNKELADYVIIGFMEGRGLRPLGYFFDLHSQYYFPLLAAVLVFYSGNGKVQRKDALIIVYLLTTIFLSGVKTAIYSITLILFFMYVFSDDKKKYTKYILLGGVFVLAWGAKKVIELFTGQDAILELYLFWEHFLSIPYKLIGSYPISFLFGGTPSLKDDPLFYSEVYWVTLLFFIGIVGVFLYIKSYKTYYLSKYKFNNEAFYVFLVFAISLLHYSVFNRGVNMFASALVFMYLFVYLEREKEIKYLKKQKRKTGKR